MPKFSVVKSKTIEAPAEEVFGRVRDFHEWPAWSPWLIAEPDCPLEYEADGRGYAWDGKIVGSGKMALLSEEHARSLDMQLTFLKPWKSTSDVRFDFAEQDGKTNVTWRMDGSLPLLMFWMKGMMTTFVGMDYDRGLAMLKDLIETGQSPSRLEFPGEGSFEGFPYVGIQTTASIAGIGPQMKADFNRLCAWFKESGVTPSGPGFSIYHKWAPTKDRVDYTCGFQVEAKPADLPGDLAAGELGSCRAYRVQHIGALHHLGNAWAAGMMHGRAKRFRKDKSTHPFEIYETAPGEVPESETRTTVHFPVK